MALTLGLAVFALSSRGAFVQVPVLQEAVPVRSFVAIGAGGLATVPLRMSFPELAATLPREMLLRPVRSVAVVGLALAAFGPAVIGLEGSAGIRLNGFSTIAGDTRFCLLLVALAILSVVLLGDYGWLPVLTAGVASTFFAAMPGGEFTRFLVGVPAWGCPLCLAGAMIAYSILGAGYPATRYGAGRTAGA